MNIGKEYINRFGKGIGASLLAMIMVLSIALPLSVMPVAATDPWEGYLVPQNSTGDYGTDTLVELWANVTTDQVWGYQADLYFDTGCVNVTDITYTSAFPNVGWSWNDVGGGRAFVRFYGDRGGSGNLPPGTYHLATATLHGESPTYCVSDLEWQNHLVSDDNGEPIQNSYTDGTYTCGEVSAGICCMCCADGCEPGDPCEYDPEIRTQEECTEAGGLWLPGETDPEACAQYHCDEEGNCVPEVATIVLVALGLLGVFGVIQRMREE